MPLLYHNVYLPRLRNFHPTVSPAAIFTIPLPSILYHLLNIPTPLTHYRTSRTSKASNPSAARVRRTPRRSRVHVEKVAGDVLDEPRCGEYARLCDKADFDLKRARFLLRKPNAKLGPFVKLGKRLIRHAESILQYFTHRVSNSFAEGIDNKIKIIKRMTFGSRDFECFRLKILAATGYLRPFPSLIGCTANRLPTLS